MKFNSGDVVIKTTGGNKMTIYRYIPVLKNKDCNEEQYKNLYECYWFVGSHLNQKIFLEKDIVTLQEYKRYLLIEERDDKLNKILS